MKTASRTLGLVVALAAILVAIAIERSDVAAAGQTPAAADSWVRYALPGPRMPLTMRWQLLGAEGEQLVLKVDTYLDGELRSTKTLKRDRIRVPEQYRMETIVAGGRKYECKVFQLGSTTYWYSEDVPVLGIVRSQNGDHDIMELLEASAGRRQ